jgi:transposase
MGNYLNHGFRIPTNETYYVHNVNEKPYKSDHRNCCYCHTPSERCIQTPSALFAVCKEHLTTYKSAHEDKKYLKCNLRRVECNICTKGREKLLFDKAVAELNALCVDSIADRVRESSMPTPSKF